MKLRAVLVAVAYGLFPLSAAAQHVICCNLLVDVKGDWIGASRQCRQVLDTLKPEQIVSVCEAVGRNACEDVAPYCQPCTGDEPAKRDASGNTLAPGDPVYDGLVDGVRKAGIAGFGPQHFSARNERGRIIFHLRIDGDGCALPAGDCILAMGESGRLPRGKQVGARQMLFGSVQTAGTIARVSGRYVYVETGVIEGNQHSDTTSGTGRAAIADAMADMLGKLGLRCKQARGIEW